MEITSITSAEAAHSVLKKLMRKDVEEFWALALGPSKLLLRAEMIFRGTVDACLIHPRDVFRFACSANASSLLVAHNHPSGDPRPSEQDILITRKLIRAASLFEIPLLDHLILTHDNYVSFAVEGWCRFSEKTGALTEMRQPRRSRSRAPESGRRL